MPQRRTYAIVGTGSRAQMYLAAMAGPHADVAHLVAAADSNPGRLDWSLGQYPGLGQPERFAPAQLGAVIAAKAVDRVIITTPDYTHADYIVTALRAGADVVVEKPLTIDQAGVRAIAAATQATGHDVTITFNYRYAPRNAALRRIIAAGDIGQVLSVHFEWVLDTAHGADYFRRWHRQKDHSGGLLIHKASHHFDLVNWWIADNPSRVFASGGLRFYGRDNAERWGLTPRPDRGTTDSPLRDRWCLDLRTDPVWQALYLDQEHFDGYRRDRDVFDPGITIEDNLSLVVDYAHGASMSYSLNAHCPWEGYRVAVNGSTGRAELNVVERGRVAVDEQGRTVVDPSARPDLVVSDAGRPVGQTLTVQRHFEAAYDVPIEQAESGHGGGDARLLRDVFVGPGDDTLGCVASWVDGVRSLSVGLAGNQSLATGQPVEVSDLDLGEAAGLLPRPAIAVVPA